QYYTITDLVSAGCLAKPLTVTATSGMNWDISICVCTFRRPELLMQLLTVLPAQFPPGKLCEIVVVDNDPERSAAAVFAQMRQQAPDVTLRDLHVGTPNIALARNAAVAAAQGTW